MKIETIISTLSKEGSKKPFPPPSSILKRWALLFILYALGTRLFFPLMLLVFILVHALVTLGAASLTGCLDLHQFS